MQMYKEILTAQAAVQKKKMPMSPRNVKVRNGRKGG